MTAFYLCVLTLIDRSLAFTLVTFRCLSFFSFFHFEFFVVNVVTSAITNGFKSFARFSLSRDSLLLKLNIFLCLYSLSTLGVLEVTSSYSDLAIHKPSVKPRKLTQTNYASFALKTYSDHSIYFLTYSRLGLASYSFVSSSSVSVSKDLYLSLSISSLIFSALSWSVSNVPISFVTPCRFSESTSSVKVFRNTFPISVTHPAHGRFWLSSDLKSSFASFGLFRLVLLFVEHVIVKGLLAVCHR